MGGESCSRGLPAVRDGGRHTHRRAATRLPGLPQKDAVLEELERLTEGLVERARASHDPALGLSLRMNEARRGAASSS